jgi:hypothetical protein
MKLMVKRHYEKGGSDEREREGTQKMAVVLGSVCTAEEAAEVHSEAVEEHLLQGAGIMEKALVPTLA